MPSATYVARRPGPFSSLVESAEIGGLQLEAHPPRRVLDRYFDTDDGELLRQGLALRVREQGGAVTAALRPVEGDRETPPDEALDGPPAAALALPDGPLAETVAAATGGDPLRPLLTVRQYRTPRVIRDGEAEVGVATFDVVVYEGPGARVVSNEVEVEPVGAADPLARLAPVFEAHGLERAARSKVARGIVRMPRSLSEPALLLPDERRRLEAVAVGDDPALRRRAQVVLLDARGFRADTIATQTGLSMARVRHWRQRFRDARLGLLEPEPAPPPRRPAPRPAAARPAEPSSDLGPPPARPAPPGAPPEPPPEPPPEAPPASVSPVQEPPPPLPPPTEGDGLPIADDPAGPVDMASLLDLFSPTATETPLFGPDDDDEAADLWLHQPPPASPPPAPLPPVVEPDPPRVDAPPPARPGRRPVSPHRPPPPPADPPPKRPAFRPVSPPAFDPYPVVLGPVAPPPPPAEPARPGPPRAGLWETPPRPSGGDVPIERPTLPGGTPLLRAAEATLGYHLALFDARSSRFVLTRAPSDARRLLVAAHGLRLAVETFETALPSEAARRLVAALRPLVADLDAAVQHAQAAATSGRDDLARRAAAAVASAADRLARGGLDAWGARARRLVARLVAQAEAGALRSDDAPLADDFVGPEGSAPTATRLRHVLGGAVWGRFEALRAFEDDLDAPTDELAAHLAVALSALHFVLGLAAGAATGPLREVAAALEAAERAVVAARRERLAGGPDGPALAALADVWEAATADEIRARIAALVASI